MTNRCRECFHPLPEPVSPRHARRRYCNNSCKQAAWRGGRTVYRLVAPRQPELALESREGACPRCDLLTTEGRCFYCEAELKGIRLESIRRVA
jgi:hypothetical protein